ncbi:MAG: PorT family protein [Bacteroidetes bacterium]|nr:PorT family protein [Bacteroidota bacterium]
MRKSIIFLLLFFLMVCSSSQAQQVKLGINAGISIPELRSKSSNEISKDYKSRLASVFGAFADFNISNNFSIKTFINYAGQGGKRTGMQPVTNIPQDLALMVPPGTMLYANFHNVSVLNYLEFPVMAKWEWGNSLRYYLNLGPYIGFLLSAKQKTSGSSQFFLDKGGSMPVSIQGNPLPAQSFDATTDVKSDINHINFGFTGGAGIGKYIGKSGELVLDVRAADGLTTIQKDSKKNGNNHTGGLFITLGYAKVLHAK